jgi:RNA-splicing ligase RtcB
VIYRRKKMLELNGKYTTANIFASTIEDEVIGQVMDIINSKAFYGQKVVCMPDVHVGKSGPCGLVATIGDYVCPEHIGVDIGCTVSMMILDKKIPEEKYADFEHKIKNRIPFGMNLQDKVVIDEKDFYKFLSNNFKRYKSYWPERLYNLPNNVTESWISDQLKRLDMNEGVFYKSLGTVGGGNHFIEYDEDDDTAAVTLHFGSRHFGVKVCAYWMKVANQCLSRQEIKDLTNEFKKTYLDDHDSMVNFKKDLDIYIDSKKEGNILGYLYGENMDNYLCEMCFAQLYARYNHLTVQNIISKILQKYSIKPVRDIFCTHNFIDLQDHTLRKSSIRSYIGEEMIVPFNMRDGVAICEGKSNSEWLNPCAHGAGRKMSRSKAKENVTMEEFKESMKNVYSTTVCEGTIDESPMAYKDTNEIAELIKETCVIKKMLAPRINIKATC